MPGRDQTGPMGRGALTGRGAGYCSEGRSSGYLTGIIGQRFMRGRGGFGGRRGAGAVMNASGMRFFCYGPELSAIEEKKLLRTRSSLLQGEIDAINLRIKELETALNNITGE